MPRSCLLCLLLFAALTPALPGQGSLTPPGAPAATMKSLNEIDAKLEKRTPISAAPFTISSSGSYYLTQNLSVTTGTALNVTASNVTVDLNGFAISSTASPRSGNGIQLADNSRNVSLRNGHIQGTTSFNAGTYSGGGFANGIAVSGGGSAAAVRVSDVSVSGCGGGILLNTSLATYVSRCTVMTVSGGGLAAATVQDCAVRDAGGAGILGLVVQNCASGVTGTGPAIQSESAANCQGVSVAGPGVAAYNASNCRGQSTSGNGLVCDSATNCVGESVSGAAGISVTGTASFCRGLRNGGVAIDASLAIGCTVEGSGTVSAGQRFLGTP